MVQFTPFPLRLLRSVTSSPHSPTLRSDVRHASSQIHSTSFPVGARRGLARSGRSRCHHLQRTSARNGRGDRPRLLGHHGGRQRPARMDGERGIALRQRAAGARRWRNQVAADDHGDHRRARDVRIRPGRRISRPLPPRRRGAGRALRGGCGAATSASSGRRLHPGRDRRRRGLSVLGGLRRFANCRPPRHG